MSRTLRSITFKNSILNKLYLNEIQQNPICPVERKFRTKTNRISTNSIISIEEEITSIKSIKPYNTQKVIHFQPSDYKISSIVATEIYKNLHQKFLQMINSHKNQKLKLKKQIKEINESIKEQSYKTNKLVDKLVQLSQNYGQTQTKYYQIRRKKYALRCEFLHRRGPRSQINWINQYQNSMGQIDLDQLSYEEILQMEERIGKENTGFTLLEIERFQQTKFKNINSLTEEKEDIICCICCEDINQEDTIIKLSCFHIHHAQCLKKWLKIKRSCPLCKTQVNFS